jgi:peptide/nickel transport system ATP-binding protein
VTLTGIPGRPPSLVNPPAGCRFRERCPFAFDKCTQTPPFAEIRPGHLVACWKVSQEQTAVTAGAGQEQA